MAKAVQLSALAQISPLSFSFGRHAVRIVVRDGEPWFVASDIAAALGYRDAANAGRILSEHQRGTQIVSTQSGDQSMTVINESGLYRLVLRSRKPEAEKFSDWVTGEVLPSIRKTGTYSVPYAVANSDTLSAAQQTELRTLIQGAAERLPHSARAAFTIAAWSKLKAHFKTDYRHIPTAQYGDALNLLARHIAQALAAPQPSLPLEHCPECANCARLSSPVYSLPNIWAHLTSPGSYLFDKQTLSAIATDCINKLAGKPFPDYLGFNNHTHYEGQVRTDLSGRNS